MAACGLTLSPTPVEDFKFSGSCHNLGATAAQIQVFLATFGPSMHMVPLEVSKLDSIQSIKIRLRTLQGFYVDQPRLVHAGRELVHDKKLLQDYGIQSGDVLYVVLRLSDLVSITVKTASGKSCVYTARRTDSIRDLKKYISNREGGLPLGNQVLTLKGEYLEDGTVINDLPFGAEAVVYLLVQKPAKFQFKSVNRTGLELVVTATAVSEKDDLQPQQPSQRVFEGPGSNEAKPGLRNDQVWNVLSGICLNGRPATINVSKFPIRCDVSDSVNHLVKHVRLGLYSGQNPKLTSEGSGGVYLMKDECGLHDIAVFKPMDEEPMALNNPRGFSSSSTCEGLKSGTRSGEGAIREVAAYLLDHAAGGCKSSSRKDGEGFAGVPPTTMVRCYHKAFNYSSEDRELYRKAKIGSLQQYVHAVGSCEDMGSSLFPVEEVHKISVLDLRLANTDRHGGNILVCRGADGALKLVPIDHGYCLPDKFEECTFEWLYWPQARQPYGPSTVEYIKSLDAEQDIGLLQQCGWSLRPQLARVLRISTMVLKKGASAGLTPFQIGSILSRAESLDVKSPIEVLLEQAEVLSSRNTSEGDFLKMVECLLDDYISRLEQS